MRVCRYAYKYADIRFHHMLFCGEGKLGTYVVFTSYAAR